MLPKLTFVPFAWFICLCIAGCVTAIDLSLPHQDLPTLTVATDVRLVASPAHPTSYLTESPAAANSQVTLLGATRDMSWLLVLHERTIGWMPTFFVRDNISTLTPAITFTPPVDQCTTYLDATFALDEPWITSVEGAVRIVGAIYRPAAQPQFNDSTLNVVVDGAGQAVDADYVHTALTPSTSLILFAYHLTSLQKGSQVSFQLEDVANESIVFEAAYFADSCSEAEQFTGQLPVGMPRGISVQATTPPSMEPTATPPPASTGIVHVSDARTPTLTPTPTPLPTLDATIFGGVVPVDDVVASSSYYLGQNYVPHDVIDGNIKSYWISKIGDDIGAWLELHLTEPIELAGVRIYAPSITTGSGFPKEILLEFSDGNSQSIILGSSADWYYKSFPYISTNSVKFTIKSLHNHSIVNTVRLYEIQLLSAPIPPVVLNTGNAAVSIKQYTYFVDTDRDLIGNAKFSFRGQNGEPITKINLSLFALEKDIAGEWILIEDSPSNQAIQLDGTYIAELKPQQYLLTLDVSNITDEPIVPGWYSDDGYDDPDKAHYRGIIFPVEAGKTTDIEVHFSRLAVGVLDEAGKAVRGDANPGWTVAVCADALLDVAEEALRCAKQAIDRRGAAAFQLAPGDYHIRVTSDAACYWEFPIAVDLHEAKEELVTIDRSQPDGCGDTAN